MASDSETLSPSEFVECMKPDKLAYLSRAQKEDKCNWVFWSEENDKSQGLENLGGTLDHGSQISKKIKDMLQEVRLDWWFGSLIQFWTPKKGGDGCFLTTSNQPFALYKLSKKCCSYRKQCMEQKIYICEEGDEEQKEEQLGPVGRAFRNKQPESSPDVRFYSLQEFPLVDYASLCFLPGLIAFPVFEIERQTCVGVLEFLGSPVNRNSLDSDILSFEREFEVAGLALNHRYLQAAPKDQPDSWKEIKEALKVVAGTHPFLLALAFVPLRSCENDEYCRDFSDSGLLKLAFSEKTSNCESFDEFISAHKAFHLQKGKGVAGKAFASLRSCICRNICDFTVTEYPLVHYARLDKLNLSFAMCLQTTQLKKDLLVIEFFLSPDSLANPYSFLHSLLRKLREHIQSFEIVAEDVLIEELFPKVSKSFNNDEVNLWSTQNIGHSFERQMFQSGQENEQLDTSRQLLPSGFDNLSYLDGSDFLHFLDCLMSDGGASDLKGLVDESLPSGSGSPCPDSSGGGDFCYLSGSECGPGYLSGSVSPCPDNLEGLSPGSEVSLIHAENSVRTKRPKRQAEGEQPDISFNDIQQHFGKPLCDAARCLKVSISTLKRRCRQNGIHRWPRPQQNKGYIHTPFAMENSSPSSQGGEGSISISETPSPLNLSLQENVQDIAQFPPTVTIKVSYEGRTTIRFWLQLRATLAELEEEVAKRLKLNVGSFRMTYNDEEDDCISITCDADLEHCMVAMTSIGRTTIKMAAHLNSN